MKHLFIIIVALGITGSCFAQDFQREFQKYSQDRDTLKQRETLMAWEKAKPTDSELFPSYFNYYFLKSREETVSLTTEEPKGNSLVIVATDSSYIGSRIIYHPEIYRKGLEKIDKGIQLYPNRLDMRFGKIYVLGLTENWQEFTGEIIKAIQYSAKNNNQWTWTNNENRVDPEVFFLSSLQDYQLTLYNTEDDSLLPNMRAIANEVLKYYPRHVTSLSNLAISYLLVGEYDKGIEPLLKAETINPQDMIVLGNIAYSYKQKGDKKKAIEYYEKILKYADKETQEYAKKEIEELKK